ncbi:hypothetical protein C3486_14345 [Streptomyces sp. Ru73]|nr:hypothetical protein C3486_14345 [Streptomyces sp. Ru73]
MLGRPQAQPEDGQCVIIREILRCFCGLEKLFKCCRFELCLQQSSGCFYLLLVRSSQEGARTLGDHVLLVMKNKILALPPEGLPRGQCGDILWESSDKRPSQFFGHRRYFLFIATR